MARSGIEQQMYTRERRGLFRGSEGYDSIAKSPGLSDGFIKESVHCYCAYNPSRKLQAEGAPAGAYPPAYTLARYPDGRTLLGRAVYVAADFTGQRATFFAHNYVLPAGMEAGNIGEVAFLDAYDIALGNELPVLDALPTVDAPDAPFNADTPSMPDVPPTADAPSALDIPASAICADAYPVNIPIFSKLVSCVIQSLAGTKKIYVQVPVPPGETSRYALGVLETLYRLLPPPLTQNLGFLTYAREPENKKGLNIIFLENGALRPGDSRVARDFFIDVSRGDAEAPQAKSETREEAAAPDSPGGLFAKFLWENAGGLKPFHHFTAAFKENLTPAHWDKLTEIYKIVLAYNADARAACLRSDAPREESPVQDTSAHDLPSEYTDTDAFAIAAAAFLSCATENPESAARLAALARDTQTEFFAAYINLLLESGNEAHFLAYAETNLRKDLFAEASFWLAHVPAAFQCRAFVEVINVCAGAKIDEAADPFTAAATLYEGAEALPVSLNGTMDEHLKRRINFEDITRAQLAALPQAFIQHGKKGGDPAPYVLLEIVKDISGRLNAKKIFRLRDIVGSYNLTAREVKYVVTKLRVFFTGHVNDHGSDQVSDQVSDPVRPRHFENLAYLYHGRPELLAYVDAYGNAETKASFLVWAVDSGLLSAGDAAAWAAVRDFIAGNIKDGVFKERLYAHPALKMLSREMRFGKIARLLS